jgi:ATP-dependent RNA helicase HelY
LRRRIDSRTSTISRQFDRICLLLSSLGYLNDAGTGVTDAGRLLARIYGETDLVVAESLRAGHWQSLTPWELASVCAALVYESRGRDEPRAPRLPGGAAGQAIADLLRTWDRLKRLEEDHRLKTLPDADLGLCWPMFRWAKGHSLDAILWESELTAGDFVRWTKQVIDLLGQIAQAAPDGDPVGATAVAAAGLIDRGVVSFSGLGGAESGPGGAVPL